MKFLIFCLIFSICVFAGEKNIVLVKDGKPKATIIISEEATRISQFAAYELQYHIKKITGAKIPIVKDDKKIKGTKILVGESRYTRRYGIKSDKFKDQEYLIRFFPNTIILIGKDKDDKVKVIYPEDFYKDWKNLPSASTTWPDIWDQQGTLYATYDFLERYCWVKWLNPTEFGTYFPKKKTLVVKGYYLRRKPFFSYRDVYTGVDYESAICLWKMGSKEYRNYLKDAYPSLSNTWIHYRRPFHKLFFLRMKAGGKKCFANHSLYDYYKRFPPEKYPEIWAKGYQGTPNQLCYTSEKLIELVAKDAENYFKLPEEKRKWGKDCFAVVPMDNRAFCKCEKCQKLISKGKNEGRFYSTGTYSEYFFNFVNEVAKRVKKTNPDKWIITLAYDGYAKYPDTIKFQPNVIVMFCFTNNRMVCSKGYIHEIKLLKEWAEKCKKEKRPLELWLYYTFPKEIADNGNFHCFPGFFAHKIGEQIRMFKKLGIKGMFHCGYGQEVEAYVTFKLMDNPDLNVDKLLDEYFNCLYGNAAKPMKDLYLLIEKIYTDPKNYPQETGHQTSEIAWGYLGRPERMRRMEKLLEEAKKKAKTEKERKNIKLFEDAIWSYMVAGFNQYKKRTETPIPEYEVPKIVKVKGDLEKVDWKKGIKIGPWYERGSDKKSERKIEGVILHDVEYLYLKLIDWCDTKNLASSSMVFPYDDWEIFIAKQRALPYRHIAFNPKGQIVILSNGEINFRKNLPVKEHGVKVISKIEKDRWISEVAIPFSDISVSGFKKGEKLYINIVRVSSPKIYKKGKIGIETLVPFTTVHELERLAELKLKE